MDSGRKWGFWCAILSLTVAMTVVAAAQKPKDPPAPPVAPPAPVVEDDKAKAEAEEIAQLLGRQLNYRESGNFTWCASIDDGKLRPIIDAAEKAYQIVADDAGFKHWKEMWGDQRAMVVILPAKREYEKYNKWYAEKYPVWNKQQFIEWHNKSNYYYEPHTRRVLVTHVKPNDEDWVRNVIVHVFGHECIFRLSYQHNSVPSWLEECMGIWIESTVVGKLVGRCFKDAYAKAATEADERTGYSTTKWKARVRQAFKTHNVKRMTALWKIEFFDMSLDDACKGYAVVAWMRSQPGKMTAFMKALKAAWPPDAYKGWTDGIPAAQAKALKEVFGMTPEEVDMAVEKFVQSAEF